MLYACALKFDVTGNLENFLKEGHNLDVCLAPLLEYFKG